MNNNNFSKIKLGIGFVFSLLFTLLFIQTVSALSFSPAKISTTLNPGEEYSTDILAGGSEPGTMNFDVVDFYINENGAREFLTPKDDPLPTGLKQWITLENNKVELGDDFTATTELTINVPEDIEPGAYYSAVMVAPEKIDTEGQVVIATRGAIIIEIDIAGEGLTESAEILSFEFDENGAAQGNYQFITVINNTGTASVYPRGEIVIYDANGEKVSNIQKIMKEVGGAEVVQGFNSELPFNTTNTKILPEQEKRITTTWSNPNITNGNYTATLNAYYGQDSLKLIADDDFQIFEGLNITEFNINEYNYQLPIKFSGRIQNKGGVPVNFTAQIKITNIFGQIKEILPVTEGPIEVKGGGLYNFSDIEWLRGAFFGPYKATLEIKQGEQGLKYEETQNIFIAVWWQIVIALLVIIALIAIVTKLIISYRKMAQKAKEADTE